LLIGENSGSGEWAVGTVSLDRCPIKLDERELDLADVLSAGTWENMRRICGCCRIQFCIALE
jgi:hypothetical protein